MKRFLVYLLILVLFLAGCGIGAKQSNTISQNTISKSSLKTNASDIKWKWSFKNNHKTLENLQIFKSTDKGNSWTEITLPINTFPKDAYSDAYVENVEPYFLDSNNGWISWINYNDAALYIFKTTDGGKTWSKLSYKLPQFTQSISKIQFVTPNTGWLLAVSDGAAEQQIKYLFRTNDGGKTWEKINVTSSDSYSGLPLVGTSTDMIFYGVDNGWVGVSNPISADVILYKTMDGGNTWSKVSVPTPQCYEKYCIVSASVPVFKDDKNGTLNIDFYRISNGKSENHTVTYVTNDGGNTWSANVYADDENKHIFNIAKIFWNSDGDRIAFIGEKNSDFELCTIDLKNSKYSVINKLNPEDIKSFNEKSIIWK
ncbi:MAG: hypothetical protein QJR05_02205 [Thermoanaerobacterium sp.]|nr:hypothetical protein [Thermoanaerobacterium sp.]